MVVWGDKPYYSYNYYMQQRFHQKVGKLPIDAGFTCPNRDGTVGTGGCIFCSNRGSGDFAGDKMQSIPSQLEYGRALLSKKWAFAKYIAYFQAFSNTYAPVDVLKQKYYEALRFPDILGISIATRPDCLPPATLDLLSELNQQAPLWVELGLQTTKEETANWFHRGYPLPIFEQAVKNLSERKIETVVHIILGLPNESPEDMLHTVTYLSRLPIQGVKLHFLYVAKNTVLGEIYEKDPFPLFTLPQYAEQTRICLEALRPDIVIHRLTGDSPREMLIAPLWSLKKHVVLNTLHKHLKECNSWQGKGFVEAAT